MRNKNVINRLNSIAKIISEREYHRQMRIELYKVFYKDMVAKTFQLNVNRMITNKIIEGMKNNVNINMESLNTILKDDKVSSAERMINAYTFVHESMNNITIKTK